jgi:hypothetical protein
MKDTSETLLARMDRLLDLTILARCAAPQDRARLQGKIELAGRALLAVAQAQEAVPQTKSLNKEAGAEIVYWRNELAALLAELRIMNNRTLK